MFTKYLKDQNILVPLIMVTWTAFLFASIIILFAFLPSMSLSDVNACKKFYGEEFTKQAYEKSCVNKEGNTKPLPVIEK